MRRRGLQRVRGARCGLLVAGRLLFDLRCGAGLHLRFRFDPRRGIGLHLRFGFGLRRLQCSSDLGLLLGPAIPDWRKVAFDSLQTEVCIEGKSVGKGSAMSLPGGPLAGLAFALARCARRGLPMKSGYVVSTGATTGVHEIRIGQEARVVFAGCGELLCRAVPAQRAAAAQKGARAW